MTRSPLPRRSIGASRTKLVGVMAYEAQIAGIGDNVPGKAITNLIVRRMQSASARDIEERRAEIVTALSEVAQLEFVNGGGTGSIELTASEWAVTEIGAGSGFSGAGATRPLPLLPPPPGRHVRAPGHPLVRHRCRSRGKRSAPSPRRDRIGSSSATGSTSAISVPAISASASTASSWSPAPRSATRCPPTAARGSRFSRRLRHHTAWRLLERTSKQAPVPNSGLFRRPQPVLPSIGSQWKGVTGLASDWARRGSSRKDVESEAADQPLVADRQWRSRLVSGDRPRRRAGSLLRGRERGLADRPVRRGGHPPLRPGPGRRSLVRRPSGCDRSRDGADRCGARCCSCPGSDCRPGHRRSSRSPTSSSSPCSATRAAVRRVSSTLCSQSRSPGSRSTERVESWPSRRGDGDHLGTADDPPGSHGLRRRSAPARNRRGRDRRRRSARRFTPWSWRSAERRASSARPRSDSGRAFDDSQVGMASGLTRRPLPAGQPGSLRDHRLPGARAARQDLQRDHPPRRRGRRAGRPARPGRRGALRLPGREALHPCRRPPRLDLAERSHRSTRATARSAT